MLPMDILLGGPPDKLMRQRDPSPPRGLASGNLSALLKGIQLVGQLQEDSGTEDCGRDCALTENGEGAAGRHVEADMLLWAPGSHGGLRALRFSVREERFSSCPEPQAAGRRWHIMARHTSCLSPL